MLLPSRKEDRLPRIGVVDAPIKSGDKLLIAQCARGELASYWGFPGGKVLFLNAPIR